MTIAELADKALAALAAERKRLRLAWRDVAAARRALV